MALAAPNSKWFGVNQLEEGVWAISEPHHWEKVRSFLFIGTERALLIDTGTGICDISRSVAWLTKLPVTVLTTHAHWDHYGNHHRFDDVFIHESDADWLRKGLPISVEDVRSMVSKEPFDLTLTDDFDIEAYTPPIIPNPQVFRDGAVFENGVHKIVAIHTPGHSPGGTCFFEERTGFLATGDLLCRGTIFANYPSTDPKALVDSFFRLADVKPQAILPGHNQDMCGVGLLDDAVRLAGLVRAKNMDHHGTGSHNYNDLTFLF
jgi:glyoxylase-like metal-dependent hydrolase (beta-lactamase superfamily II)